MLYSIETHMPTIKHIAPAMRDRGLKVTCITIDISRRTKDDSVNLYFVDNQKRIPFFKLSARDTSTHSCSLVDYEGWAGAYIEIETVGFGNIFVSLTYDMVVPQNKVDKYMQNTVQLKTYVHKHKIIGEVK